MIRSFDSQGSVMDIAYRGDLSIQTKYYPSCGKILCTGKHWKEKTICTAVVNTRFFFAWNGTRTLNGTKTHSRYIGEICSAVGAWRHRVWEIGCFRISIPPRSFAAKTAQEMLVLARNDRSPIMGTIPPRGIRREINRGFGFCRVH